MTAYLPEGILIPVDLLLLVEALNPGRVFLLILADVLNHLTSACVLFEWTALAHNVISSD